MKFLSIALFILILLQPCLAQQDLEKKLSGEYNPLELVSISKYASFEQAVRMLSSVSQLVTGKNIVSTANVAAPIGVEIKKMPYMDALNLIVNAMNLTFEEKEGSIIIKGKDKTEEEKMNEDVFADLDAREVKIAAVFFEADIENSVNRGIDWNWLLSQNGVSIGTLLRTQTEAQNTTIQQSKPPEFNLSTETEFNVGKWKGNATAMFRFFESENLGEIIASPNITVRDRQKGRIQIGSDFSIKQRDFSGNIIDRFYSAGSIIEVTPYVYRKNSIDYILLKLSVERSTFFPSELTTEVKKTSATTDVLLLNGEETVIGGLYVNEETTIRNGIPFLKDLPWWVLGIRYLTGSDQVLVRKKEVIILLHAELLQTLEQRVLRKDQDLIQEKLDKDEQELKRHRTQYIEKEKD
ncbi:MAG: type II secretion system protein GspD [Syntrophothermus sp.]